MVPFLRTMPAAMSDKKVRNFFGLARRGRGTTFKGIQLGAVYGQSQVLFQKELPTICGLLKRWIGHFPLYENSIMHR